MYIRTHMHAHALYYFDSGPGWLWKDPWLQLHIGSLLRKQKNMYAESLFLYTCGAPAWMAISLEDLTHIRR